MNSTTFHGDDVAPAAPDEALFHIIPVPLEETVSYGGGTARGPQAILAASCQLELFDGASVPAEYGLHTAAAVDCSAGTEHALAQLRRKVAASLAQGAVPVVLGGEHSLSLACIEGLLDHHDDFGVIQFDAHADLRHSYEGSSSSHACVMRRIWERGIPIHQIGTRSYSLEEHRLRLEHGISHTDAGEIWRRGTAAALPPHGFPGKIFITFDADCFDSSLMPATGTPVPGGLFWHQVSEILETLFADHICLGFDLVELAPQESLHGASFTMAQLAYNMMGYLVRSPRNTTFYAL